MKLNSFIVAAALSLPVLSYADWTPYVGVGGGLQYFTQSSSITNTFNVYTNEQTSSPINFTNNHRGGVLNVFAGIGNTFSNNVYTALEFNVFYNPATYTSSDYYYNYNLTPPGTLYGNSFMNSSIPWRFDLSGIVGYRMNNWMPFARLGVDIGHLQSQYQLYYSGNEAVGTPISAVANVNANLVGGTIGLGTRYNITDHWFFNIEGDYTRFLNENTSTPSWYLDSQDQPFIISDTSYNYHYQTALWNLLVSVGYQF